MELLYQISSAQYLFPAAAVAVVLVCAALVFIFGFHSAEQPQFDKLPLVVDDRKSSNKKRKTKDKKSSPNRTTNEDVKVKSDSSKKSPVKEKKEEKTKDIEKPKPKERPNEVKTVKKESPVEAKKGKKQKSGTESEKPADFDEGVWEEVPKKSDKKKTKGDEVTAKKESPAKKNKKKINKDERDVEAARSSDGVAKSTLGGENETEVLVQATDDVPKHRNIVSAENELDEEAQRALQAQVDEFHKALNEAERRDRAALGNTDEDNAAEVEDLTDVKDLRSNKKKENKEKQKKKANEAAVMKNASKSDSAEKDNSDSDKQEDKPNAPVFDELGDTWTDAKASKKSKKKARKDQ